MSNDQQLGNILERLITASRELLDLLEREAVVLAERDVQSLVDVLQQKQRQVEQVESLEHQRQQRCDKLGLSVQDLPKGHTPAWQQVLELARQCQQKNRDNHALLVANQRYVDEALRILAANGEAVSPAYTASGTDSKPGGRSFGQA